ncbi:hypothetical protein [Methylomonas koyamae]|uniref:hypothetical protein n=1 Tax=Methylomonas koyamae TaxID=702114 RepID=UPI000AB43364|nr:hypothetical protein [Methylomonas koyamae]
MEFSYSYTVRQLKPMTGNGASGVIESLDRPIATGLALAASLFDSSSDNTIVTPDKSVALNRKVPPSLAAFVNAFLRTR